MRYQVLVKLRKNFIEVEDGVITVGVVARPEKGRANVEALTKIARYFKIPRSQVRLVSGAKSKRKIIEII